MEKTRLLRFGDGGECVKELRFDDSGDRSEDDDAAVNENVRARDRKLGF